MSRSASKTARRLVEAARRGYRLDDHPPAVERWRCFRLTLVYDPLDTGLWGLCVEAVGAVAEPDVPALRALLLELGAPRESCCVLGVRWDAGHQRRFVWPIKGTN